MRNEKLSKPTRTVGLESHPAWRSSSCPGEGHHSGAEKMFDDITRLSKRTGYLRGGGKC